MQPWLAPLVEKSLNAVYDEVPVNQRQSFNKDVLPLVISRLFEGYTLSSYSGDIVALSSDKYTQWEVSSEAGDWQEPVSSWLKKDLSEIPDILEASLEGVPFEAFSWCGEAFKAHVMSVLSEHLPGWQASINVRNADKPNMTVQIRPLAPLLLAMDPKISSVSLPTLLHSELKEELLIAFSPFVGLPLPYFALHKGEGESWMSSILDKRYVVRQTDGTTKIVASEGQVSKVDVQVESKKYTIWAWAAGYAGSKDKATEIGLHLGRKALPFPYFEVELYGEFILEASRWNLESRLGARWSPWGDVWLGAEYEMPHSKWWARASIDPRINKPYAWGRYSQENDFQWGVGFRLTEHISIEVLHDSRDDEPWSIRAIGNL